MNLPKPRISDTQGILWADLNNRPIRTWAQTRNLCGEFYERATAAALNSTRLRTDGTMAVCPDLRHNLHPQTFIESKSVGSTGHSIIYAARMRKDRQFSKVHDVSFMYSIWHHRVRTKDITSEFDLYERLAAGTQYLIVLPLTVVYPLARSCSLKVLNKKYRERKEGRKYLGYADRSKGYGIGWSIPLKKMQGLCPVMRQVGPISVGQFIIPRTIVYTDAIGVGYLDPDATQIPS